MLIDPSSERHQSVGPDPIDPPASVIPRDNQPGRLQQLEVLHDRRTRNRQTSREIASRPGRASEALKDDHSDRVTEQSKQTQHLSKLRGLGV